MSSKKKILLIQSEMQPSGGANAVKTWMIEALIPYYDITVLSWFPVDLDSVNRYYGSDLRQSDIKILVPPGWIRWLINNIPRDPYYFQGYSYIMRWCKMIRHRYDTLLTTHNETDFGKKGIQYVHYPYQQINQIREPVWIGSAGVYRYILDWIKTHIRPWRIMSGFSFHRMKQNLTLVNSNWTGALLKEIYGVPSVVLYPPVPDDFPKIQWKHRENGFVCIGRLSAEKKVENMIDILSAVRVLFPDVHMHIIGFTTEYDKDYYQRIQRRINDNNSWIFLHLDISRKELTEIVSHHRYGIHAMQDEHFGIAVAEMVCSGNIVFVPNCGGQVEIIGHDSRLLYDSKEKAVEKIIHVLNHSDKQASLRRYLNSRKELFSREKFTQQLLYIMKEFESNKK
jgi:glycosyltransferase involved in cell wall biosynthesis